MADRDNIDVEIYRLKAILERISAFSDDAELRLHDVKTAIAEADDQPAPPIEVEMRVESRHRTDRYRWQCHVGRKWLGVPEYAGGSFDTSDVARADGNAWLATVNQQLAATLVPRWEDEKLPAKGDIQTCQTCGQPAAEKDKIVR